MIEWPTVEQCIKALKTIDASDLQKLMLEIHYQAPQRTITATQMANALGYQHYLVANSNYGRLGRRLGKELGLEPASKYGVSTLVTFLKPGNQWEWIMRPEIATALERLGWVNPSISALPDEIDESSTYKEGTCKKITVNAYERSLGAKQKCIEKYGYACAVCNTLMSDIYGELGHKYIHVHHLKKLSDIGKEYEVNPDTDLLPVCPNCHAIIHRRNPPYSIEEMRELIQKNKKCEQLHAVDG